MSILKRVADLLDANINALIDKMEDPEKMLNKYIMDMDKEYREIQGLVAKSIAARNLTEKKYNDAVEEVAKWEKNAMLAVEKGNDELAKKALIEQSRYEKVRDTLKPELEAQNAEVENLKDLLYKLENKINEAKSKRDLLIAQANNAKTKKKIAETTTKISGRSSVEGFSRMEEKVNRMAAEAEAASELSNQTLEAQFESLKKEGENLEIEDKLRALKEKMNKKEE